MMTKGSSEVMIKGSCDLKTNGSRSFVLKDQVNLCSKQAKCFQRIKQSLWLKHNVNEWRKRNVDQRIKLFAITKGSWNGSSVLTKGLVKGQPKDQVSGRSDKGSSGR